MKLLAPILALLLTTCSSTAPSTAKTTPGPRDRAPTATSPVPTSLSVQLPASLQFTLIGQIGSGGPAAQRGNSPLWIATGRNELVQFSAVGGASPLMLPAQIGSAPQGIAVAPDGSIWISESDSVLHVSLDHKVTTISIGGAPNGRITVGPDRAIWVTELGRDQIARISTDGQVREFPLPAASQQVQCGGRCPYGITTGPDGNLWITESQLAAGDLVGRMTTAGQYQDWPLPEPGAALNDIAASPDGALWFGEGRAARLGRVTTDGRVSEQAISLPPHVSGTSLVSAGDRLIWFAGEPGPPYTGEPVVIGAAAPDGGTRLYTIAGSHGPAAAVVPIAALRGVVVDVVTSSGEIWQGMAS